MTKDHIFSCQLLFNPVSTLYSQHLVHRW